MLSSLRIPQVVAMAAAIGTTPIGCVAPAPIERQPSEVKSLQPPGPEATPTTVQSRRPAKGHGGHGGPGPALPAAPLPGTATPPQTGPSSGALTSSPPPSLAPGPNGIANSQAAPLTTRPVASLSDPSHDPRTPQSPVQPLGVASSLRVEDWALAERLLSKPSPTPSETLAAAYVDAQLDRPDAALAKLDLLEGKLPELKRLVSDERDDIKLRSGRYAEEWPRLVSSTNATEMLGAAERFLHERELIKAYTLITRGGRFARSRRERAEHRYLRAELALAQKRRYAALMDFRWLALSAPLDERSRGVDERIVELFPRQPLTPQQRLKRADQFAEAGRIEELERELAQVERAPFFRASKSYLAHLRAWARYRARRFSDAAGLLQQAADLGGAFAAKDRYYAARALSRSGQPLEAAQLFRFVDRSEPKTALNATAAFRVARQWSLLGMWSRAASEYAEFLKRYPNSEHTEAARRELAVAAFAAGDHQRAISWLRRLRALAPKSSNAKLYHLVEALSLVRDGQVNAAKDAYRVLAKTSPTSFEAWVARARLASLGETLESPVPAVGAPEKLPALSSDLAALADVGLDKLAESELRRRESEYRTHGPRRSEVLCNHYDQLDVGQRQYQIAYSAASNRNFFGNPAAAPRWLWECLFPRPHRLLVQQASQEWGVPAAFIYSVMRQESAFRHSAKSHANARGLMQVIPPTARAIAAAIGVEYRDNLMFEPKYAVRFGSFYLRKMLNFFGGHPSLAAAAYNAGPEAVSLWEHAGGQQPLEVMVARIPFHETRNYVRRVTANLFTYQALYPELGTLDVPLDLALTSQAAPAALKSPNIRIKHDRPVAEVGGSESR